MREAWGWDDGRADVRNVPGGCRFEVSLPLPAPVV